MTAARLLALVALAAAVAGGLYLGLMAENTSMTCRGDDCVTTHASMVDDNGAAVLLLLLMPALLPLTLLGLIEAHASRAIEWALVGVFLAGCLVSVFSVGGFYLPAALLCCCAVAFDRRPRASQPV